METDTVQPCLECATIYTHQYDYDYEITLFEHKQNQPIHIIIVQ